LGKSFLPKAVMEVESLPAVQFSGFLDSLPALYQTTRCEDTKTTEHETAQP
jgi:hypothetical protein